MTLCQTWSKSSHWRHPWFDTGVMKRKHPSSASPTPPASPAQWEDDSDESGPPLKRRRGSPLELGFAHLTLRNIDPLTSSYESPASDLQYSSVLPYVQEIPALRPSVIPDLSSSMDTDSSLSSEPETIIQPGSVEEPTIHDIDMKTSSWYEAGPNRIVITDLDSFGEEDEEDQTNDNPPTISINPAFLERIKARPFETTARPPPAETQALVLFKPLSLPALSTKREDVEEKEASMDGGVADYDAMDLGP